MLRIMWVLWITALLSGCISGGGQWGKGGWPSGGEVTRAARTAALDPGVWLPLAGAAVLMVDDFDAELSESAARSQHLFDDDANDLSDDLQSVLVGTYVLSALAAPSESVGDKIRGLSVGAATMVAEGVISKGIKRAVRRERPNGRNNFSLPSGHAGRASALATMTNRNLRHIDWQPGTRRAAAIGVHTLSAATAWARVEANKHHASDVLIGNALGRFIAVFMQEAFLEADGNVALQFVPMNGGGGLRLVVATP